MTVLAVILKVVLVILAVVLALVLMLLLIPFGYRVHVKGNEGTVSGEASLSWLFRAVAFEILFNVKGKDRETSADLRVFGLSVDSLRRSRAEKRRERRRRKRARRVSRIRENDPELYEEMKQEARRRRDEKKAALSGAEKAEAKEEELFKENERIKSGKAAPPFYIKIAAKAAAFIKKVMLSGVGLIITLVIELPVLPLKIIIFLTEKLDKVSESVRRRAEVVSFAADARTRSAVFFLIRRLFRILGHIKPEDIEGNVIFGTGDPALTAEIYGGCAAIWPVWSEKLRITPDMTEKVFEGDITVKGRAFLVYLLHQALVSVLNKDVRFFIRGIRKLRSRDGEMDPHRETDITEGEENG